MSEKIQITQEHIDTGRVGDAFNCAIAVGLKQEFAYEISVTSMIGSKKTISGQSGRSPKLFAGSAISIGANRLNRSRLNLFHIILVGEPIVGKVASRFQYAARRVW